MDHTVFLWRLEPESVVVACSQIGIFDDRLYDIMIILSVYCVSYSFCTLPFFDASVSVGQLNKPQDLCGGNLGFIWSVDKRGVVLFAQTQGNGWEQSDQGFHLRAVAQLRAAVVGGGHRSCGSKLLVFCCCSCFCSC